MKRCIETKFSSNVFLGSALKTTSGILNLTIGRIFPVAFCFYMTDLYAMHSLNRPAIAGFRKLSLQQRRRQRPTTLFALSFQCRKRPHLRSTWLPEPPCWSAYIIQHKILIINKTKFCPVFILNQHHTSKTNFERSRWYQSFFGTI